MPNPTRSPAVRPLVTLALLVAGGCLLWTFFGSDLIYFVTLGPWGPGPLIVLLVAVAAALAVRPVFAAVATARDRVRRAVAARRTAASVLAAVVSAAYLTATAIGQGRSLRPYVHDEFSYLIQAHQFAAGHLWMRPHPLAAFFDSFQLFVRPAYASAYFPGTAVAFVPGVWLHLPAWVTAVALIAGVVAGLLFRVAAELFDGVGAVVAVALLWADSQYRTCSTMVLGQMPLLAYGLGATVAWLAWRADGRRRWAIVAGACLSLAAVTRPIDALCFAVPIGLATSC